MSVEDRHIGDVAVFPIVVILEVGIDRAPALMQMSAQVHISCRIHRQRIHWKKI
jgi:hypothetical protein